jgi:hypothetical protein
MEDLDPTEIEALLDEEFTADALLAEPPAEEELESEAEAQMEAEAASEAPDDAIQPPPEADEAEEQAELDFDQLEKMIAGEEASLFAASAAQPGDMPHDGDESPSGPETEVASQRFEEDAEPPDGIDLGDIESLLDREIEAGKSAQAESALAEAAGDEGVEEDLDLRLDLDFEDEPATLPAEGDDVPEETFEAADLEASFVEGSAGLEDTAVVVPEAAQAPPGDEGALDFSDIEKLLEEEVDAPDSEDADEDLELILDFPTAEEPPEAMVVEDDKFDPLEADALEDAVTDLDESLVEEISEVDDFDLDLDLEEVPEEFGGASVILEGEEGLQLETLGSPDATATLAGGPGERPVSGGLGPEELEAKPFEMGGVDDDVLPTEVVGGAIAAAGAGRPKPRRVRKTRKSFWVMLILVLLGAGGYAAFNMLDVDLKDIRLPVVDRFFKKDAADSPATAVSLADVQNRFVTNARAGILFVITGRVKNGYDHTRSYFEVKGVLNATDGRPLKTMTAYCGNLLSDNDLAELDASAIQMRLNNRAGANRSNIKVPPNRTVPFMLVFSDLPANLGEFSVEPAGSAPAN